MWLVVKELFSLATLAIVQKKNKNQSNLWLTMKNGHHLNKVKLIKKKIEEHFHKIRGDLQIVIHNSHKQ